MHTDICSRPASLLGLNGGPARHPARGMRNGYRPDTPQAVSKRPSFNPQKRGALVRQSHDGGEVDSVDSTWCERGWDARAHELWLTAIRVRLERPGLGFPWLSGVEADGTPVAGQFASTPLRTTDGITVNFRGANPFDLPPTGVSLGVKSTPDRPFIQGNRTEGASTPDSSYLGTLGRTVQNHMDVMAS